MSTFFQTEFFALDYFISNIFLHTVGLFPIINFRIYIYIYIRKEKDSFEYQNDMFLLEPGVIR